MITVDMSDAEDLARQLERFASRSLPFAVRDGINTSAFRGRKVWQQTMQEKLTLRNKYTERSVRVEKSKTLKVRSMEARLGSVAEYMERTEKGGTETAKGKHGHPIPTEVAAGQPQGSFPRTKPVRAPNRMSRINTVDKRQKRSRKARNAAAIQKAIRTKKRYVFLDLDDRKGIFKIMGGKRKPKIKMIWSLSKKAVRVPPTPTLEPALNMLQKELPEIHRKAVIEQLKRNRLLGY